MNNKVRFVWLFVSLIAALMLVGLAVRMAQAESPAGVHSNGPAREVVVALGQEPLSLYLYHNSQLVTAEVLEALMDGPFTNLAYDYQTTILTKMPTFGDGDEAVKVVTVGAGSRVVADNGNVVDLILGVVVRPAGCRDSSCAVVFTGTPLPMEQIVVTFTLRSNVRWSDGVALTTQDSVFSKQIACDPDTPTSKYTCERTAAYTAPTALTAVWVGLPGYLDPVAQLNFWAPLPTHVLGTMTAAQILNSDYGRHPLGWGPFRMVEWVAGSHITLERNPYYWRAGYPKLDRVTFRWMPNPAEVYQAMLRGEVQVASQTTSMQDYATELLDPDVNRTIKLLWAMSTAWEHMDFGIVPADGRYPFFADPQVRRAVGYAIDRQRIIDVTNLGLGAIPNAYIPAEHPLYTTTLTTYPYSPTQAAALLTSAGWVDTNSNGIRDRDGREFVITYSTTTAATRVQAGTLIQEDLAAVGIQVNLNFLPSWQFFADGPDGPVFGRKFDLATFAWLMGVEPSCGLYLSSEMPTAANGWRGRNITGYSNPLFDAACRLARGSLPGTPEHVQGHQTALRIFTEDLPALPLFQRPRMMAVSSALSVGPIVDPTQNTGTWNIWEWDITTEATAEPETETTLIASNSIMTGTFAAGTFTETAVLAWTNLLPLPTPPDLGSVARFFSLEAIAQTSAMLPIEPQQPYTLTITYAQASVPSNVREDTLKLYYWDGTSWEVEPTSQVDVDANIVTATPDHLSTWAILGIKTTYTIYLPLVLRGG